MKGTVEKCLAHDVVLLLQDMIKGKFSTEWKVIAKLIRIEGNCQTNWN